MCDRFDQSKVSECEQGKWWLEKVVQRAPYLGKAERSGQRTGLEANLIT